MIAEQKSLPPYSASAVWHPATVDEACDLKKQFGAAGAFVSGGTLLRTRWEAGLAEVPAHLINLGAIPGLVGWTEAGGHLLLGSQTTLSQCREDQRLQARFPLLTEAVRSIAAVAVRNLATIGGNIVSAVGDSLPALLLYDAELIWRVNGEERTEPLAKWLEEASAGTAESERVLLHVKLPLQLADSDSTNSGGLGAAPGWKRFAAFHKVGRREAFTPSLVTAAVCGEIASNGTLAAVRLALAGGQTTARRFAEIEAWLEGSWADEATMALLHDKVSEQFDPKPDPFASADYLKRTAANLVTAEIWKAARTDVGDGEQSCC